MHQQSVINVDASSVKPATSRRNRHATISTSNINTLDGFNGLYVSPAAFSD
jgi:hypothetical protein